MTRNKSESFSPLIFLASLGAGGIAVMPFAFLQYAFHTGKGLVTFADIGYDTLFAGQKIFYHSLEAIMILFALIHIVLTVSFLRKLIPWVRSVSYRDFIQDPLKNAGLLAPFISIIMTMNVVIGPIRYFVPSVQANFQAMMLPALLFWILIFVLLLRTVIRLLTISFEKGFDVDKINFGWLLHPFALGMLTVVGTGIAAMAQNSNVAHIAAFLSMISGMMGIFLLLIKLVVLFKSHFNAKGLPARQFLPSFLIVIPNITLFAISMFRFGHYLEVHHGFHLGPYFFIVIGLGFAFEIWYLLFGLSLLKNYFKNHYFKKEFYVTQWGLICPFVAFGVLASFSYKIVLGGWLMYLIPLVFIGISLLFYFDLLRRHLRCKRKKAGMVCL